MPEVHLHLVEYAIEATLLGTFMLVACSAAVGFAHPASPVARAIGPGYRRRVAIGFIMGLTAIALIYSPLGQRSGAHMNPATTLTFYLLGKVAGVDALGYALGQVSGAVLGVGLARAIYGRERLAHAAVRWAMTLPGPRGPGAAFAAEFGMTATMMSMVLLSTNHASSAPFTGLFAGVLIVLFITFIAPLSGMSMNPARSLASALHARAFTHYWVYATAPALGMVAAGVTHVAALGADSVYCAKLQHPHDVPCVFFCREPEMPGRH